MAKAFDGQQQRADASFPFYVCTCDRHTAYSELPCLLSKRPLPCDGLRAAKKGWVEPTGCDTKPCQQTKRDVGGDLYG